MLQVLCINVASFNFYGKLRNISGSFWIQSQQKIIFFLSRAKMTLRAKVTLCAKVTFRIKVTLRAKVSLCKVVFMQKCPFVQSVISCIFDPLCKSVFVHIWPVLFFRWRIIFVLTIYLKINNHQNLLYITMFLTLF